MFSKQRLLCYAVQLPKVKKDTFGSGSFPDTGLLSNVNLGVWGVKEWFLDLSGC